MKELLSPREIRNNQVLRDLYDESTLPYSSVRRKAEIKRRHRAIARWIRSQAKRDSDAAVLRKRRRLTDSILEHRYRPRTIKGLDGSIIEYRYLDIILAERKNKVLETKGWSDLVRRYGKNNVLSFEDWKKLGFFDFYNPKKHIISRIDAKGSWLVPNIVLKERPTPDDNRRQSPIKARANAKIVFRAETEGPGTPVYGSGHDGEHSG
jgi:hypothetical protein